MDCSGDLFIHFIHCGYVDTYPFIHCGSMDIWDLALKSNTLLNL